MKFALLFFLTAALSAAALEFEVDDVSANAFGHPFPSLDRDENREFFVGNSFFKQAWVRPPSSTAGRDGLGPTFNASTCTACHLRDGRGRGIGNDGRTDISLLFRLSDDPIYGGQINPVAVTGVPAEARTYVSTVLRSGKYPDGAIFELREPNYRFVEWAFGEPDRKLRISPRVGTQLIGLGLVEKIPAELIVAGADPEDADGDGISGRVSWVVDRTTGQTVVGRMGWKAEQPSLRQQNAGAFLGDMGLTTSLFPEENCPAPQAACRNSPNGGVPEVTDQILDRVTFYTQTLAVPKRRNAIAPDVVAGERHFKVVGCASCHQPNWQIEADIEIHPFSDFLLHDMGPGLSDRNYGGEILATEWRTPLLWGIGLIPAVNGHSNLLHDGRARNVEEAILWHDGEGAAAREKFVRLSAAGRLELIRFVESL